MKNQTLDSQLLFAQNAITRAMNNEPIKALLSEYGYDEIRLSTGLALYRMAAEIQEIYKNGQYGQTVIEKETNKVKAGTPEVIQRRDEAFEDLQNWMNGFIAVARIALAQQSEYLEVLAITEPS